MPTRSRQSAPENDPTNDLTISPDKVCSVIAKVREFEVKAPVTEPDPGSNPTDDHMIAILEDHADDPVVQELRSFISAMSEDEQVDLVALAWLGRNNSTIDDWPSVRAEAARAYARRTDHTANYLLGMPLVSESSKRLYRSSTSLASPLKSGDHSKLVNLGRRP